MAGHVPVRPLNPNTTSKWTKIRCFKATILFSLVIAVIALYIALSSRVESWRSATVSIRHPYHFNLSTNELDSLNPLWSVKIKSHFLPPDYINLTSKRLYVSINRRKNGTNEAKLAEEWSIPVPEILDHNLPLIVTEKEFYVPPDAMSSDNDTFMILNDESISYQLEMTTQHNESIRMNLSISSHSDLSFKGLVLAACVLIFLYTLIIFEIVHRTLAAMIGATAALAALTIVAERPSLEQVATWIDVETLTLLFSMMLLVAVLCETGFFDYLAVWAFRLAKGEIRSLLVILCILTAVLSAFLDNVTTILLITPVTIKLCEIKNINPKNVLIAQVLLSNIGGAATPVGDPPNVIIINSNVAKSLQVDFTRFTFHVAPGVILVVVTAMIMILYMFRDPSVFNFSEPTELVVGKEMVMCYLRERVDDIERENLQEQINQINIDGDLITDTNDTGEVDQFNSDHEDEPLLCRSWSPQTTCYSQTYQLKKLHTNRNPLLMTSRQISCQEAGPSSSPYSTPAKTKRLHNVTAPTYLHSNDTDIRHELDTWKKAHNSLQGITRDEKTVQKVLRRKVMALDSLLHRKLREEACANDTTYEQKLADLERKYKIRNGVLLVKTLFVLSGVLLLFFLQGLPQVDLSLGWIAVLGAIGLLILADVEDLESIFARVEWSTLIFFASLFVVMEALTEMRLLWFIGQKTESAIAYFSEEWRLLAAVLIILWVSALASSFIDNIPFATVMIKIIEGFDKNPNLNLPIAPLMYALAFGACLGGNGTLIGASANVVCAGVAEHHGYRFSFLDFFKIGFPVMIVSVITASVYLILCHVVLSWN